MATEGQKLETRASVGSDSAGMSRASTVASSAPGTAWTIALFLASAVALSATPGLPVWLRPLPLHTEADRTATVASLIARPKMTLAEHERIYQAIAARDPNEAAAAMRDHLTRANELYRRVSADAPSAVQPLP